MIGIQEIFAFLNALIGAALGATLGFHYWWVLGVCGGIGGLVAGFAFGYFWWFVMMEIVSDYLLKATRTSWLRIAIWVPWACFQTGLWAASWFSLAWLSKLLTNFPHG